MYTNFQGSTVHNSPKLITTQVFVHQKKKRTDKQTALYPHNGKLIRNKKESATDISKHMDKSGGKAGAQGKGQLQRDTETLLE